MTGERIASVNFVLDKINAELSGQAASTSGIDFYSGIVTFANRASWHVYPDMPLPRQGWKPVLETGGLTALGAAYGLVNDCLRQLPADGQYLPPLVIVLTDGRATDDVNAGLQSLLASSHGNRAQCFAIGVGNEVDDEVLLQVTGQRRERIVVQRHMPGLLGVTRDLVKAGITEALSQVAVSGTGTECAA